MSIQTLVKTSTITNTKLVLATLAMLAAGGAAFAMAPRTLSQDSGGNNVNNIPLKKYSQNILWSQDHDAPVENSSKFSTTTPYLTCEEIRDRCIVSCSSSSCKSQCSKKYDGCKVIQSQKTYIPIIDNNTNLQWIRNRLSVIRRGSAIVRAALQSYSPYISPSEKKQVFMDIDGWSALNGYDQRFIKQLTHCLYIEQHHLVPWSILDYTREEIISLFTLTGSEVVHYYQDPFVGFGTSTRDRFLSIDVWYSSTTDEYTEDLFVVSKKVIGSTQAQEVAIKSIIDWEARNFTHGYKLFNADDAPDTDEIDYYSNGYMSGLFKNRIFDYGCHSSILLLLNLLRSLNIPAYYLMVDGHGVGFMPTINKYIHGDAMAFMAAGYPADYMLATKNEVMDGDDDSYYIEATNRQQDVYLNSETMYLAFPDGPYVSWPNKTMFILFDKDWVYSGLLYGNGNEKWEKTKSRLPEFNLPDNPHDMEIYPLNVHNYRSTPIPIRSLEQLSGWE